MCVIEISHLTKDYGNKKGIFDLSLHIKKGKVQINGLDCWKQQKEIQKILGYLPGEIAFFNDMTGRQYINMIAKMRKMKDMTYAEELLELFEINPNANLKRMSKGMKQKIGIVTAFMHNPQVILLDEPTSGLDPLMQNRFIELVENEKKKGKTIIMSSHIFEEVERTCDRIGIIKEGHLIQEFDADELRHSRLKSYKVEFYNEQDLNEMIKLYPTATYSTVKKQMTISIHDNAINKLLQHLSKYPIYYLKEEKHTLEDYFMQFYGGANHD